MKLVTFGVDEHHLLITFPAFVEAFNREIIFQLHIQELHMSKHTKYEYFC